MQTIKHILQGLVLISFLFLSRCNESPKTADNTHTDTSALAKKDAAIGPVYDPVIDALIVGAAFTKKLADSLGLQIIELTLKPGDSLPMHSHTDHAFYLMDTSTAVVYVPGQSEGDTLSGAVPGIGWVIGPFTDAAKNIGKTTIRAVEVAVHRPRGVEIPANPAYDSTIDAFSLGGESIHKLADTLGIKMFIVTMKPGDTAKLHSHPDHTVYVLEGGELAVTIQGGQRQIMKMQKGMGLVDGPLSDAAKNIGKTTIKLLMTHIYRPRG